MKNNHNKSVLKMIKYQEEEIVPNAWSSDLPWDLVGLISVKLLSSMSLSEYIRFGSVCIAWRSFSIENYQPIKLPGYLPVLLIPLSSPPICCPPTTTHDRIQTLTPPSLMEEEEEVEDDGQEEVVKVGLEEVHDAGDGAPDDEIDMPPNYYNPKDIWDGQDDKQRFKDTRNLYNISENTVYDDFPFHIPYYKNIRGSSHGWLVTVEEGWTDKGVKHNCVQLVNPFRTDNNKINLPPFPSLSTPEICLQNCPSRYLQRVCLSISPSSLFDLTELVVLGVSLRSEVFFCRPGDKVWTHLKDMYKIIQDMFCYKGMFYAILQNGYVFAFVIDATDQHPKHIYKVGISPPPQPSLYPIKTYTLRYLVNGGGYLLQIRREILNTNSGSYQTSQFMIFKFDSMDKWHEIKTLNNYILFLGGNSTSMFLCALDCPGCKPNSIYYTDNFESYYSTVVSSGPHDIGVYNVEDGSFERYYDTGSVIMPSPVWIQPFL